MDRCTRKLLASAAVASGLFVWSGCSSSAPPPVNPNLGPSVTEKKELEQREGMMREMMKNKPGEGGAPGMPGMPPGGPRNSAASQGPR
jgi:hypothetical protein